MNMYNEGYCWGWRGQVVQPSRGVGSNGQKNVYCKWKMWSRNIKNGCSIYIYDISRL